MLRTICLALASAFALAPAGERLESTYPEGSSITVAFEGSFRMQTDEVRMTLGDMELPPEALEGMDESFPSSEESTRYRCINTVLESAEGRPTRVRRLYEELRQHSVEAGEEKDETGVLEGLPLLLREEDGEPIAELEDGAGEVDERYLADHHLDRDEDVFLPDREVELGDEWSLDEDALRRFMGLRSSAVLFELDEDELDEAEFEERMNAAASVSGQARMEEQEERDGIACAVIAFTIEVEAALDDLDGLDLELEEGMPPPTGSAAMRIVCEGKLWHALAEGRPVALEQTLQGTMTMQMEMRLPMEDVELSMQIDVQGSFDGEATTTWSAEE
jgi:hypothetical protein